MAQRSIEAKRVELERDFETIRWVMGRLTAGPASDALDGIGHSDLAAALRRFPNPYNPTDEEASRLLRDVAPLAEKTNATFNQSQQQKKQLEARLKDAQQRGDTKRSVEILKTLGPLQERARRDHAVYIVGCNPMGTAQILFTSDKRPGRDCKRAKRLMEITCIVLLQERWMAPDTFLTMFEQCKDLGEAMMLTQAIEK